MLDSRLDNDNNTKMAYAFAFPFFLTKTSSLPAFDGKAINGRSLSSELAAIGCDLITRLLFLRLSQRVRDRQIGVQSTHT